MRKIEIAGLAALAIGEAITIAVVAEHVDVTASSGLAILITIGAVFAGLVALMLRNTEKP